MKSSTFSPSRDNLPPIWTTFTYFCKKIDITLFYGFSKISTPLKIMGKGGHTMSTELYYEQNPPDFKSSKIHVIMLTYKCSISDMNC